ncbi:recombinase family protein [Mesorhizobium sp. M0478]
MISPLLANIYLHYVLDLWAQRWRQREATGDMIIVRYADDVVVRFEHEGDARRFLDAMRARLDEFAQSLHPDKTRLIEFGRFAAVDRNKRGLSKPETFAFLGFTFICGKSRRGRFQLQRRYAQPFRAVLTSGSRPSGVQSSLRVCAPILDKPGAPPSGSTELQYSLVDRAVRLGWPPDRVVVIDEDLGKSGNGQVERGGFQRLIAEIGFGNAGLVVSLDASRLARNNRDWHQLLELCSLFGVIIADGERLYDPCAYHDRLLLGLSGIMSEAELHQIRIRLHQGERQKAARGELRIPLPGGLTYNRSGQIVFNPDEEVQARLRLIFDKFRELQTARRVMRYLRTHDLRVPVRPLRGPAPHELVWRDATIAHVHHILHNPAYAGAYVYGRRRINAIRQGPGSHRATSKVAIDDWEVCIKDAHPGY